MSARRRRREAFSSRSISRRSLFMLRFSWASSARWCCLRFFSSRSLCFSSRARCFAARFASLSTPYFTGARSRTDRLTLLGSTTVVLFAYLRLGAAAPSGVMPGVCSPSAARKLALRCMFAKRIFSYSDSGSPSSSLSSSSSSESSPLPSESSPSSSPDAPLDAVGVAKPPASSSRFRLAPFLALGVGSFPSSSSSSTYLRCRMWCRGTSRSTSPSW
mmetsp:Transcript_17332/g.53073  ORF Transcript_17332/g.53073 Transcript_17332/m.53073 type:complete len:217 (-) Transcript_17332:528-1178(-)